MKHILLIFLLLPTILSAQMDGTFYTSKAGQYESFAFYTNGEFAHEKGKQSEEFNSAAGHGRYTINNDTLTLTFERGPAENDDTPTSIISTECKDDSITIDVLAYSANSLRPVPFAYVSLYSLFVGGSADVAGHYMMRVKRSNAEDVLVIHERGYAFKKYPISLNRNYSIKTYLTINEEYGAYANDGKRGEVRKYLMHRIGRKWIRLKRCGEDKFSTYRKLSEEELE